MPTRRVVVTSSKIFISYSRADSALVAPVVALLRASRSFVYLDSDSIRPGKKWRDELGGAIAEANIVVVFWCSHSDRSDEVRKEVSSAIAGGKDVLPLLIDSTELPAYLADYQYIDFRAAFERSHQPEPVSSEFPMRRRAPAPRAAAPFARPLGLAVASFVLVSFVALWLVPSSGPDDAPVSGPVTVEPRVPQPRDTPLPPAMRVPAPIPGPEPPAPPPPPPPEVEPPTRAAWAWIVVALLPFAAVAVIWRRRRTARARVATPPAPAASPAAAVASEIERTLLRKLQAGDAAGGNA